jgi:hypothetical protein
VKKAPRLDKFMILSKSLNYNNDSQPHTRPLLLVYLSYLIFISSLMFKVLSQAPAATAAKRENFLLSEGKGTAWIDDVVKYSARARTKMIWKSNFPSTKHKKFLHFFLRSLLARDEELIVSRKRDQVKWRKPPRMKRKKRTFKQWEGKKLFCFSFKSIHTWHFRISHIFFRSTRSAPFAMPRQKNAPFASGTHSTHEI